MNPAPSVDDLLRRERPLFVFDGLCVLCSGGAAFLMRRGRAKRIDFASAQSPVGEQLYRHFGLDMDETYLLVESGRAFTRSDGYLRLAAILGGPWRLVLAARLVPRGARDRLYDLVASHRYRWFGKTDHCRLLTPEQRARLL